MVKLLVFIKVVTVKEKLVKLLIFLNLQLLILFFVTIIKELQKVHLIQNGHEK